MPGSQQVALVDQLLTGISNKITPVGFVAELVLPMVEVVQTTGLIGSYGTSHMRIVNTVTGGKNKYPTVETGAESTQAYNLALHGLSDIVTKDTIDNKPGPFDAVIDTTGELTTLLQLAKEKGLADSLTSSAIITSGTTLSGTSQYNDYTNSDPLVNFNTARTTVRNLVGVNPDTVIMSLEVVDMLSYHPKILEVGFKYTRRGELTLEELAKVMKVKRILVAEAMYETAKQGQTSSLAQVWGKHIVFAVAPTSAARRQVSLGYRFQKKAKTTRKVYKNTMTNPVNAIEILVDDQYDQLLSMTDAAYLITDAIA